MEIILIIFAVAAPLWGAFWGMSGGGAWIERPTGSLLQGWIMNEATT
jgi:hypothetical protein